MVIRAALAAGLLGLAATVVAAVPASAVKVETPEAPQATNAVTLELLSRHTAPIIEGGAEIVSFDPESKRLFVVNANEVAIDVLDLSDPAAVKHDGAIQLKELGGVANSVSVMNGMVAVALEAFDKQDPGFLLLYDADGDLQTPLMQVQVGSLPDMVKFAPNGHTILVACEGEPDDPYVTDPEGEIWIVDIKDGVEQPVVKTATFTEFNLLVNELLEKGVRVFGPGASVAKDLEPEYIAVSPNSRFAYVALQENNAIAVVDVQQARVLDIVSLGVKDFSLQKNSFDPSNKDGGIHFHTFDKLKGMYQPDSIVTAEIGGELYLFTANEGDARDYEAYSEEARVHTLTLDPEAFPDAETLQAPENLGRLKVTNTLGDTDGDGDYDELYAYGARSFSIWKLRGETIELVYDSGNVLEAITAAMLPENFNSTDDENNSFDDRSDDKGPEPEAIDVGVIDGKTYVFVGLERIGGVAVFDVSNPEAPIFVTYRNDRDFSGVITEGTAGDCAPECVLFIPAGDSPNGENLLVVANEVSGTTTIYHVKQ